MSKPEHLSLSIAPQHNGLVLLVLFVGTGARRRVVTRQVLVVDLEEGWPTAARMLSEASEIISRNLR